jgi:hypothetical protein
MYDGAFKPGGNSILIAVTSDASVGRQVSTGSIPNARFLATSGSAWVAMGSSSIAAVVPTTAVPANGVLIPSAIPFYLDIGPNVYLSAVSSAGATATLYVTPGLGGR